MPTRLCRHGRLRKICGKMRAGNPNPRLESGRANILKVHLSVLAVQRHRSQQRRGNFKVWRSLRNRQSDSAEVQTRKKTRKLKRRRLEHSDRIASATRARKGAWPRRFDLPAQKPLLAPGKVRPWALKLPTALGNQTMEQPLRLEQVRARLSDYLVTQRGGHGEIGGSAWGTDGLVGSVKDVRLYGINKYRFCILLICRRAHKSEMELFSRLPQYNAGAAAARYQPHTIRLMYT
jgi:hypothetical protein